MAGAFTNSAVNRAHHGVDNSVFHNMKPRYLLIFYFTIALAGAVNSIQMYRGTIGGDFLAFHTGWSLLWDGKGSSLYDLKAQTDYQRQVLGAQPLGGDVQVLPYLNPPYSTIPFSPLAALSPYRAFIVWRILQLFILGLIIHAGFRLTAHWTRSERLVALATFLALPQLQYAIGAGTFSLFVLLGLMKSVQGKQKGIWLALSAVRPHFIIPVVLLYAIRQWRVLVPFCAIIIGLSLVTTYLCGIHVWMDYPRFISAVDLSHATGTFPELMINLRRFAGTEIAYIAWPLAVISSVLLKGDFRLRLNHAILTGLFFAPHTNPQELVIAAFPALLLYDYLKERGTYFSMIVFAPIVLLLTGAFISFEAQTLVTAVMLIGLLVFNLKTMMLPSYSPTLARPNTVARP